VRCLPRFLHRGPQRRTGRRPQPHALWFRSIVFRILLVSLESTMGAAVQNQPGPAAPLPTCPTLNSDDRIMVLAPHPDDESIGCGGIIQQAVAMKLPVRIVWLTNGDNNEWSFIVYR